MKKEEIRLRDPFVVPIPQEGCYYLFGTTDRNIWDPPATGFDAYRSADLVDWEGPFAAFRPPPGFWADRNFWAPEVHRYGEAWYMFASFKAAGVCRGTAILRSEAILGPYEPYSDGPVTPRDWECLDGTLYVDDGGAPWMVFCHEWVQVGDGEMCARRLSQDLRQPAGDPIILFHASEAPWALGAAPEGSDEMNYITDGPFIYTAEDASLIMLWASCSTNGYAQGQSRSRSGRITGPWQHDSEPLYSQDSGHGMVFRTFDGQLMLTLHTPNDTPNERPVFLPVRESAGRLVIE